MRPMTLTRCTALAGVISVGVTATAGAASEANPFAGTMYQSIAAIVIFVLLFVILKKYAWGSILSGLVDRENKIRADLEQAEAAAKQAEQTLAEYRQKLAEANEEARRLIDQAKADAQKLAAQLRDQAETDVNNARARAQADIQSAKEQAINDLYAQAAELATGVAGKILQREINVDDHRQLVESSLNEMGSTLRN